MIEDAYKLAKELESFLGAKGVSVWLCSAWKGDEAKVQVNHTDLVLSIGGDGTILRAAQTVVPNHTPITGINLGRLGFLTELSTDEVFTKLPSLLNGEGWIDERFLLEARLASPDKEPQSIGLIYALNDVVVARGAIARLVHVEAFINDIPLTTYKADGVIVATATGSTGYSLAAGGPILHPHSKDFLLLSITSHLGSVYPLVLPSGIKVKLRINTTHQSTLSVDGYINLPLSNGTTINVRHSSNTVRFLRMQPENNFYCSLEQKLKVKR
jgi:NAD+ kinase